MVSRQGVSGIAEEVPSQLRLLGRWVQSCLNILRSLPRGGKSRWKLYCCVWCRDFMFLVAAFLGFLHEVAQVSCSLSMCGAHHQFDLDMVSVSYVRVKLLLGFLSEMILLLHLLVGALSASEKIQSRFYVFAKLYIYEGRQRVLGVLSDFHARVVYIWSMSISLCRRLTYSVMIRKFIGVLN